MSPKRGSCLCGAIQYEVTGDPFNYNVCHCVNCQKWGGSAFSSNPFFKPEVRHPDFPETCRHQQRSTYHQQVVVTKGQEFIKDYADSATKSGNTIIRKFCKECGSSILVTDEHAKVWTIPDTGTLDDECDWGKSTEQILVFFFRR